MNFSCIIVIRVILGIAIIEGTREAWVAFLNPY